MKWHKLMKGKRQENKTKPKPSGEPETRRNLIWSREVEENEGHRVSTAALPHLWLPVTCVLGPHRCRWDCRRPSHTRTGGSGSTAQSDG